jgi:hypothetical protein
MNGITYKNTKTNIPDWDSTHHITYPIGYAYETNTHFVHFYARDNGLDKISYTQVVIQKNSGTLQSWAETVFGAEDVKQLKVDIGHAVEGVWRPTLYYYNDVMQALNVTDTEMRLSEQALRLLVEKLDDILLYIEPDSTHLSTYGHKTRELLILACTEVENFWMSFINKANAQPINSRTFTTQDYVKLVDKLFLKEYDFKLKAYPSIPLIQPFINWSNTAPTATLAWYYAYNKTKHDRSTYFSQSTLENCINAVVANLLLHCVRFSPALLFEQSNPQSSLIRQHFSLSIRSNVEYHYVRAITLPTGTGDDLAIINAKNLGIVQPFIKDPLVL